MSGRSTRAGTAQSAVDTARQIEDLKYPYLPDLSVNDSLFQVQHRCYELELELIQTQMTQKPMLRAEVYARALRASQNRKEDSL